jgi:putative DNA primase/helicase
MPTKIDKLLESYQGNAYPAMIEDLASHLGVSADSIRRLAPGWAPAVQFKKGMNWQGWWAIPERDADATPIGLSLRSQDDMKVMLPGSKHGLVYEVNPDHHGGDHGYSAGPQNWVRTMDAGVLCPVCHKPDGCLLSAENPADPKAVVCIRVKEGAAKPLKFGFLHVRKTEGKLQNASPLPASDYPVLIVEGFSDTAAAMTLGFVAIGRPSNLACMDMLRDLVRGRPFLVIGENDRKPDGREPGKEGMVAAFQTCRQVSWEGRMVMPPEYIKDLRAWLVKYGLTRDQLLDFAQKHGQEQTDATVILDDRPTTIARAFLDSRYRMAGRYTIRRWESTWYRYGGSKYMPLKDEAFIQPVYQWAYDKLVQRTNPKTGEVALTPLKADNTLVSNLSQALVAETLVEGRQVPCWINGTEGPDPKDLIVFANGILDVPTFLNGGTDYLLDSTPDLFTTAGLPIDFDPTATCPNWLAFLISSLGDDPDKVALLQEWIGYCMTPDTSLQKMMYFRGPPASGKGRILEVLEHLVGKDQTAAPSFAELTKDFGLAPLVGKLVCLVGDARTPKHGDTQRGLEILLNITGNDSVQVNRKFKDHLEALSLTARVTIASNELLDVPDHAGAMIRRLNFIEFNRSFRDNPDYTLPGKLKREIQGIALWALAGLKRLRERGGFTIPTSSIEALKEWRVGNSPTAAFLEECSNEDSQGEVLKRELYDAWVGWSTERRIQQVTVARFFERIRSNSPGVTSHTYEKGGAKISVFKGLRLKSWAAKRFTNRP